MPAYDKNDINRRMHGALEVLKHDLGGLRTGRASTALLDPIQVDPRSVSSISSLRTGRPPAGAGGVGRPIV
jgi:ribosome recycling factor